MVKAIKVEEVGGIMVPNKNRPFRSQTGSRKQFSIPEGKRLLGEMDGPLIPAEC